MNITTYIHIIYINIYIGTCVPCLGAVRRRRRHLLGLDSTASDVHAMAAAIEESEKVQIYALHNNQSNKVGNFSGSYWNFAHPVNIDPGVDEEGYRLLAFKTEGDANIHGSVYAVRSYLNDTETPPHIAIGRAVPPAKLRQRIHPGSLLIDGENTLNEGVAGGLGQGKGRLYASTTQEVLPVYTVVSTCTVNAGQTTGTATISLPYGYLFGMVGGYTSSSQSGTTPFPPTSLLVTTASASGMTFLLKCEAYQAPSAGDTYSYTANVAFFHPILADQSAF